MKRSLFVVLAAVVLGGAPLVVSAATLTVGPTAGTFSVGSTFDVSVYLDTQGESVNALEISLSFPPDKLQLVSPATSKSVVGVWTSQPRFNNQTGRIDLQGGMPGGVNVSSGLVTTLTFRVKGVGQAVLRFLDNTKVLLNDGLGTDALRKTQNGMYDLALPPPAGPIVVSKTHPEESKWYPSPNVVLDWAPQVAPIQGYSYVLDTSPVTEPDDVSEGLQARVLYKNVSDGAHYFHIKSFRDGVWGGVTHFAVNVDSAPPVEFKLEIIPYARTVRRQPIIQFYTTDVLSGVDHYELKLVPLTPGGAPTTTAAEGGEQQFFIEAQSPYIPPPLEVGDYDVIVRVYDKAGNFREEVQRLQVRPVVFEFIGDEGFQVRSRVIVPWLWFWVGSVVLLGVLAWVALRIRRWHLAHHLKIATKELPHHLREQLEELKRYRKRYGRTVLLILLALGISFAAAAPARAQQNVELAPPLITTVSRDISNEEIFYAGGKADVSNVEVVLYLQNLQSGETLSETVTADKRGDWFYRHPTFLSIGSYLLWAQTRLGEQWSPPSPQVQLAVRPTAIQFGASRLSYESLYLIFSIVFFLAVLGLAAYIVFHGIHGRRKREVFLKEVREAEESVRRGFAVLRRDIEAELAVVHKAKFKRALADEEKMKEAQLMKDLEWVQQYIGREIWEVEHTEPEG